MCNIIYIYLSKKFIKKWGYSMFKFINILLSTLILFNTFSFGISSSAEEKKSIISNNSGIEDTSLIQIEDNKNSSKLDNTKDNSQNNEQSPNEGNVNKNNQDDKQNNSLSSSEDNFINNSQNSEKKTTENSVNQNSQDDKKNTELSSVEESSNNTDQSESKDKFKNSDSKESKNSSLDSTDTAQQGIVNVKFVDLTNYNKEIAPMKVITGPIGSSYSIKPEPIDGYMEYSSSESKEGTFKSTPITITIMYVKRIKLRVQAIKFSPGSTLYRYIKIRMINPNYTYGVYVAGLKISSTIPFRKKIRAVNIYDPTLARTSNILQESDKTAIVKFEDPYLLTKEDSNTFIYIELDGYDMPTTDYTMTFDLISKFEKDNSYQILDTVSEDNLLGITTPEYYVKVPPKINFTNKNVTDNATVSLIDKDGNPYRGKNSVEVRLKSRNGFKLKDDSTNNTVSYSMSYNNKVLSETDNFIGILSENTPAISGYAKLLEKDLSTNNKFNYCDKITYEFKMK